MTSFGAALQAAPGTPNIGALISLANSKALARHRLNANRQVLLQSPASELPPLPDLHDFLLRTLHSLVDPYRGNGKPTSAVSAQDMDLAHDQLLAYGLALSRQLHTATQELLARYRVDTRLSQTALPSTTTGPDRHTRPPHPPL